MRWPGEWGEVRLSRSRTLGVPERAKRVRENRGDGGCVGHTFFPLTDLRKTRATIVSLVPRAYMGRCPLAWYLIKGGVPGYSEGLEHVTSTRIFWISGGSGRYWREGEPTREQWLELFRLRRGLQGWR